MGSSCVCLPITQGDTLMGAKKMQDRDIIIFCRQASAVSLFRLQTYNFDRIQNTPLRNSHAVYALNTSMNGALNKVSVWTLCRAKYSYPGQPRLIRNLSLYNDAQSYFSILT